MQRPALRVLFALLLMLLGSSAGFATTYSNGGYYWYSAGVRYTCSKVDATKVFKCVAPSGRVVYVTGDTEPGCRPDPRVGLEIFRTPETQCYEGPWEVAEFSGDEPIFEEQEQVSAERIDPRFSDLEDEIPLNDPYFAVPCEDDAPEGDIGWFDLLLELLGLGR